MALMPSDVHGVGEPRADGQIVDHVGKVQDHACQRDRGCKADDLVAQDLVALRRGRIHKLFVREAEALALIVDEQIQQTDHGTEGHAGDCDRRGIGVHCRQKFGFGMHVNTEYMHCAVDVVRLVMRKALVEEHIGGRKTDDQLDGRLNDLGNAGRSHVLEAFIIAAERTHLTAEQNARRDHKDADIVHRRFHKIGIRDRERRKQQRSDKADEQKQAA